MTKARYTLPVSTSPEHGCQKMTPVFTDVDTGIIFDTRVHGPWTRVVRTELKSCVWPCIQIWVATWVVWANTWLVTSFDFLVIFSFLGFRWARIGFDHQYVIWLFPHVYICWSDVALTVISGHRYNTISMLCDNTAYCVKLSGEDLSRSPNKTESTGLRKCSCYHCLSEKAMSQ